MAIEYNSLVWLIMSDYYEYPDNIQLKNDNKTKIDTFLKYILLLVIVTENLF